MPGRARALAAVLRARRRRPRARRGQPRLLGWRDLEDGRLYGRGSMDMKGGVACYLHALRCLVESGAELAGDVLVETTVDEEFGGANGTLACRLRGYNADGAVLPEPTGLAVCHATRGGIQYRLHARGGEGGMDFGGGPAPSALHTLARVAVALADAEQGRDAPIYQYLLRSGEELPWGTEEGTPTAGLLEFWAEIVPGTTREQLEAELRAAVERAAGGRRAAELGAAHAVPAGPRRRSPGADRRGDARRAGRPGAAAADGPVRAVTRSCSAEARRPRSSSAARAATTRTHRTSTCSSTISTGLPPRTCSLAIDWCGRMSGRRTTARFAASAGSAGTISPASSTASSIHAEGISRDALAGRPVIGICNSWSELVNCNLHFRGARRGGQARRAAGGRAAARVPDDLARREPDEADHDALPQPDGDGRRGVDPRLSARRGRAARRLRQDRARAADGRGERRRARDHDHRRPVAAGLVPRPASSASAPTSGTTPTSSAPGG